MACRQAQHPVQGEKQGINPIHCSCFEASLRTDDELIKEYRSMSFHYEMEIGLTISGRLLPYHVNFICI
eukprot:scaffold181560_cov48-Prasinocladus_malaysianus.AAC.2